MRFWIGIDHKNWQNDDEKNEDCSYLTYDYMGPKGPFLCISSIRDVHNPILSFYLEEIPWTDLRRTLRLPATKKAVK